VHPIYATVTHIVNYLAGFVAVSGINPVKTIRKKLPAAGDGAGHNRSMLESC
jgi:hypothetical protein